MLTALFWLSASANALAADGVTQALATLDALARRATPEIETVEAALHEGLAALEEAEARAAGRGDEAGRDALARCAFLRGELYRRAANAGPGTDQAEAWREQAAETFRRLRFDYRDRLIGLMGHVGEARVARDRGDADAAADALRPLLQMAERRDPSLTTELYRLTTLEALEARLLMDPVAAAGTAANEMASPVFSDARWQARLGWIVARGLAADGAAADAERIAALAEAAVNGGAASAFERLELLARLDESRTEPVLTRADRLAWAAQLAALGRRDEAIAAYRAAAADAPLTPAESVTLGTLLHESGDYAEAAERFIEAAAEADEPAVRAAALRGQVVAQLAMPERPTDALIETLEALASSSAEPDIRAMALHWLAAQPVEPARLLAVLEEHPQLVKADPALRYARAMTAWRVTVAAVDHTPPSAALLERVEAQEAELAAVETAAEMAEDVDVWSAARMGRVRMRASWPMSDARGALTLLDAGMDRLTEEHRAAAAREQVALLLQLGLTDEAMSAWGRLESAGGGADVTLPLQLAERLAQRAAEAGPTEAASLRSQVVELVNRAVRSATSDEAFASALPRAAGVLADAGAAREAAELLARMRQAGSAGLSQAVRDELLALEAEVLLGRDRASEAAALLAGRSEEEEAPPVVLVAFGRSLLATGDRPAGFEALRRARATAEAGADAWWEATLALADAMGDAGDPGGGATLLRAASTLYPSPRDIELQQALRSALAESSIEVPSPQP